MPYIPEPPWAKRTQRVVLAARYAAMVGLGVATCLPVGVLTPIGALMILGSLFGIVGVVTGLYRWEWCGIMPQIAALFAAVAIIATAADSVVTWLVLVLALTLLDRWVYLAREAYRHRVRHRAAQTLGGD